MSTEIGVGVIGLGRMGRGYVATLVCNIQGARVVAVCDAIPAVAEELAQLYHLPAWYRDHHELLARSDIQAVLVTTPTNTHAEVVIAAAAAGKAVLCEKPIALRLDEADAMLAAVERAGTLVQVGFMRRFDAGYKAAQERIEAGVIGRPLTFKAIGRDSGCPRPAFADPARSGGLILDMGIHDFDLARWLMGVEVQRVYSEGSLLSCPDLRPVGDIDNAVVNLRFVDGALGNVEVSRNCAYGYDVRTEIVGSAGALHIGYINQGSLLVLTHAGVTDDAAAYRRDRFGPAFQAQLEDFIDCVLTGRQPRVTVYDARAALEIGVAATQSLHSGQPVALPL